MARDKLNRTASDRDKLRRALKIAHDALDGLIDDCIVAVDLEYGTLGTAHVRRVCEKAISSIDKLTAK